MQGGQVLFPFHCNWMNDKFEFTIYDPFGNQIKPFKRTAKSNNERFTKDEINILKHIMEIHYYIIKCGYDILNNKKYKNYNDVFETVKEIKAQLKYGI